MRKDLEAIFDAYPFARPDYLGFPVDWLTILEESENKKAFEYGR